MENLVIDSAVMHIPEGVCKVTGMIERDLSRYGIHKYYVLVPVYDSGTKIYIPADKNTDKTRALPCKDEVLSLIDEIPESESIWRDNDKERQEYFNAILSRFDHHEMVRLIKTLRDKSAEKVRTGKKFHSADERVFKEAERILFGEFGFVLGIHPSEVPAFIDDRIGDQMKSVS